MITAQENPFDFECIVQMYQRRLTALATRLLNGDGDAALDVVQETFLKLWRQWQQGGTAYTPPERMDLYLLRAVHNRCVDVLRRHAPTLRIEEQWDATDVRPGPEGAAQAQSLGKAVRAAVEALPQEQRSVFILSHYEGLRYQEIADLLDCPMGTVASRKNQAVTALRRALKDWRDEEKG